MVAVFVILAICVAVLAGTQVSQATLGVFGIGAGCFVLILARITQSDFQHNELKALLKVQHVDTVKSTTPAPTVNLPTPTLANSGG